MTKTGKQALNFLEKSQNKSAIPNPDQIRDEFHTPCSESNCSARSKKSISISLKAEAAKQVQLYPVTSLIDIDSALLHQNGHHAGSCPGRKDIEEASRYGKTHRDSVTFVNLFDMCISAGDSFRQQRMNSWNPVMTPLKIIVIFFAVGIC